MATPAAKTPSVSQPPVKQPEPSWTVGFQGSVNPKLISSPDGITVQFGKKNGKDDPTALTISSTADQTGQCPRDRKDGNPFIVNFENANTKAIKTAADKQKPFGDKFEQNFNDKGVVVWRGGAAIVHDPLFTNGEIQALCPNLKLPTPKGK